MKEILGRISKIQFQTEIINTTNYLYPRLIRSQSKNIPIVTELPSEQQIHDEIELAKCRAFREAQRIGLTKEKNINKVDFSCKINPIKNRLVKKTRCKQLQTPKKYARIF